MSKKLSTPAWFVGFVLVTSIFGSTFYIKSHTAKITITEVDVDSSIEKKPQVNSSAHIKKSLFSNQKLNKNLLESYFVQIFIKPMLIKNDFFAFNTTKNLNKENLIAVDATVDQENKSINITIYTNDKLYDNTTDLQEDVNFNFLVGLLYAQELIAGKKMTPELKSQILSDSAYIYQQLRNKTNTNFIIYE